MRASCMHPPRVHVPRGLQLSCTNCNVHWACCCCCSHALYTCAPPPCICPFQARKGDVELESLPLPEEQTSDVAYAAFQKNWQAAQKDGKPNLRQVRGLPCCLRKPSRAGWLLLPTPCCCCPAAPLSGVLYPEPCLFHPCIAIGRIHTCCCCTCTPPPLLPHPHVPTPPLLSLPCSSLSPSPSPLASPKQVLWQTFGHDLMLAGLFKLLWSVCVIMGAFFFVRSILTFVAGQPPFDAPATGWILTVFFFVDAWLLGEWGVSGCVCAGVWCI